MERLQKKVEDLYWPNSRKVQKVDTVIENWALIINPCISLFRSNLSMSISFYEQDNNIIWNIIKTEGVAKRPPVGTALWAALFMVMIIQPIFLSLLVIRSSPLGEVVTQGCGLLCIILLASVYFPPLYPRAFPYVFTFPSSLCSCVSMLLPSSEWNTRSLSCSLLVSLKTNYSPTLK